MPPLPPQIQPDFPLPLEIFGGTISDANPIDLPPGCASDSQDLVFLPGSAFTRPSRHKIFAIPFGTQSVVYEKTFSHPSGTVYNLYLTSDGKLWSENVTSSPGQYTQIAQVAPGSYCQSVTANGREYFAFSNGISGLDPPYQWDGTYFDRVSMDGPGTSPTPSDASISGTIAGSPAGLINPTFSLEAIGQNTQTQIVMLTQSFSWTASAAPIVPQVGDTIKVSGTGTGFDGTWVVNNASVAPQGGGQWNIYIAVAGNSGYNGTIWNTGTLSLPYTLVTTTAALPITTGAVTIANAGAYNGTWQIVTNYGWAGGTTGWVNTKFFGTAAGGGGTVTGSSGNISAGTHWCSCAFLTRSGYLTKPSPPVYWVSNGNCQAQIANLPLGPPNVVARVLLFTPANGSQYFTLLQTTTIPNPSGGASIITPALIVADNVSTSATVNFSDNALMAGTACNITGNNLFNLQTLGPSLGVFSYSSRMFFWGALNKIPNLLNMGFNGGYNGLLTSPTGWSVIASGGTLTTAGMTFGFGWQITGTGGGPVGQLSQSAYQDMFGIPILAANTQYSFTCKAFASANSLAGSVVCALYSPTQGTLATATIAMSAITTTAGWVQAIFSAKTPAAIPNDVQLQIYATGLPNGATVTLAEAMAYYTNSPMQLAARASYAFNPESFDGVTGTIGPSSDANPIQCMNMLKNALIIKTSGGIHTTSDAGTEPGGSVVNGTFTPGWTVTAVTRAVGALSFRSGDGGKFGAGSGGPEFDFTADEAGLYIFAGGEMYKVSQEYTPDWKKINFAAKSTIWVCNDSDARRCYVGLPINGASSPNVIYVLDYRLCDTAAQIAAAPELHVSAYTGKMIATDLSRKWTRWQTPAPCGALMTRWISSSVGNVTKFCVGAGNSSTPGQVASYGNAYYFDDTPNSNGAPGYSYSWGCDDDYGTVLSYWISHFFPSHMEETMFKISNYRKTFPNVTAQVAGIGTMQLTPFIDNLQNPWPLTSPVMLNAIQNYDVDFPLNVVGAERCAFKYAPSPVSGGTQAAFSLNKMIAQLRNDPWTPRRGAVL
jgi:hypothetical protein